MTEADTRTRILDAARFLILRQGLRATTMEAIASEARVAKPTLYRYFPDKAAVFDALVDALVDTLHARVDEALSRHHRPAERLAAALTAKYRTLAELLAGSNFAEELYGEHDRLSAPRLRAADDAIALRLTDEVRQTGAAEPEVLARVLLDAAYGIGRKAVSPEAIGPAMQLLVKALLPG